MEVNGQLHAVAALGLSAG